MYVDENRPREEGGGDREGAEAREERERERERQTLMGLLILAPSAQRYSYLGPADITGHDLGVQNSVMLPSRLTQKRRNM